jgi:hypothetical protein
MHAYRNDSESGWQCSVGASLYDIRRKQMPRLTPSVKMFVSTNSPERILDRAEGRLDEKACCELYHGCIDIKMILLAFARLMYPDAIQGKVQNY